MPPLIRRITSTASNTLVTTPIQGQYVSQIIQSRGEGNHTVAVQNRHTRYAVADKFVDNVKHRCLHPGRLQVLVGPQIEMSQRLSKQLHLRNIDRDKFQDTILGDNADHHGTLGLIINIDQWNTPRPGLQHSTTCFVERAERVD